MTKSNKPPGTKWTVKMAERATGKAYTVADIEAKDPDDAVYETIKGEKMTPPKFHDQYRITAILPQAG